MIEKLLSILAGWKGYAATAIAALSLGAGAAWYVQGLRIDALDTALTAANTRAKTAESANKTCAADVAASNAAVDDLRRQAQARADAAAKAVADAEQRASEADKRVRDILRTPAPDPDQCKAVDMFTADFLRERTR
ncbi:hypothetical protein [Bradyrhizobium sp.]|uniref:hypothetical protein n=1 Tax=Bradyrhizobium sp. TaxID=376 RepID=UPI0039E609F2